MHVFVPSVQFLSVEKSDGMGEEAIAQSGHEGPNASVPFTRRQEGKECVREVCGVIHNAGGFVDAAWGVNVCDGGKRDTHDLLSCPNDLLQGLVTWDGAIS